MKIRALPLAVLALTCLTAWTALTTAASGFTLQGDAERARDDYRKYCATCHGPEGRGDGVMARVLDPQPKDFTDTEYMKTRTDEQLYLAIKEGGGAVGLSTKMAAWKHILDDQQVQDLTLLVRELGEESGG